MYVLSAGSRQDTEQQLTRKAWAPPRREYIFVFIRVRAAEPELHFTCLQLNGLEVRQRNTVSKSSWRRTIYMNQFTQTMPNVGLLEFFSFCLFTRNRVVMGIRMIRSEPYTAKKSNALRTGLCSCSAFQAALENFLQLTKQEGWHCCRVWQKSWMWGAGKKREIRTRKLFCEQNCLHWGSNQTSDRFRPVGGLTIIQVAKRQVQLQVVTRPCTWNACLQRLIKTCDTPIWALEATQESSHSEFLSSNK